VGQGHSGIDSHRQLVPDCRCTSSARGFAASSEYLIPATTSTTRCRLKVDQTTQRQCARMIAEFRVRAPTAKRQIAPPPSAVQRHPADHGIVLIRCAGASDNHDPLPRCTAPQATSPRLLEAHTCAGCYVHPGARTRSNNAQKWRWYPELPWLQQRELPTSAYRSRRAHPFCFERLLTLSDRRPKEWAADAGSRYQFGMPVARAASMYCYSRMERASDRTKRRKPGQPRMARTTPS
jgi:hypothetical protein